jgi:hypothetical protein
VREQCYIFLGWSTIYPYSPPPTPTTNMWVQLCFILVLCLPLIHSDAISKLTLNKCEWHGHVTWTSFYLTMIVLQLFLNKSQEESIRKVCTVDTTQFPSYRCYRLPQNKTVILQHSFSWQVRARAHARTCTHTHTLLEGNKERRNEA